MHDRRVPPTPGSPGRVPILALTALVAIAACAGGTPAVPDADVQGAADGDGIADDPSGADVLVDTGTSTDDLAVEVPKPYAAPASGYRVFFLDVGQGDAILVVAGDGTAMLVDGGKSPTTLKERLLGVGLDHLDVIVASHGDSDHIGGLTGAFDLYDVTRVYWNGSTKKTTVFKAFLKAAEDEGADVHIARRDDVIQLGNINVRVLHPKSLSGVSNQDSIVLLVGCPGAWTMLTGDAEVPAEEELIAAGVLSDIDVLKVSHHGAKTATSQDFLDYTKPEVAVISAGLKNAYGHPDPSVVERLEALGAEIWNVDYSEGVDGVVMTSNCVGYGVDLMY